jgi:hypothetical protein
LRPIKLGNLPLLAENDLIGPVNKKFNVVIRFLDERISRSNLINIFRYDILVSDKSYEQAYPGDENNGIYVTNRTNINEFVFTFIFTGIIKK